MTRLFITTAALLAAVVSCGTDDPPITATPFLDNAEALTLDGSNRGLTFNDSEAIRANGAGFTSSAAAADVVVVGEQIFSESHAATVPPGDNSPEFDQRIEAAYDDSGLGTTLESFGTTYMVVDLQRLDREWLVDWEGLTRDEPDNRVESLNFAREDYVSDVTNTIVESFAGGAFVPDALVVGIEMERYYLQNPGDWQNYVTFVHGVRDAVHEFYPDVQVSAGINWSNFVDTVVPTFRSQVEVLPETGRSFDATALAWGVVIDPLYFTAEGAAELDFYGFSSIPDPAEYGGSAAAIDDEHYAGIRTYFDADETRVLPVSWFSIGWQANVAGSSEFDSFLTRFLALNGGYDVQAVAWFGFSHLLSDECNRYTNAAIGVNAPDSVCYRGLFGVSGGDVGTLTTSYFAQP